METLARGLWRWVTPHPDWKPENDTPTGWKQDVASVAYEAADGSLVLIDPLVGDEPTWSWLLGAGRLLVILPGNTFHRRSTEALVARGGARVLAPDGPLPPGVAAVALAGLGGRETAYVLAGPRAVVLADAVLGAGDGEVRVAPPSWSEDRPLYERVFRAGIARLLEHDVELLLTSHGPPVLRAGAAALRRALGGPAWGEAVPP